MLFVADWKFLGKICHGFLKADSKKDAERIMREKLSPDCELLEITETKEHRITPQSITVNFVDTAQYELF